MTRVLASRVARAGATRGCSGSACCVGLAALTRNEAVWLALVWAWLAWRLRDEPRSERVRLIAVVAVVSLLVFAPWAIRNWAVFGSPLPGQAISNAMSVTGYDIFAWNDPPTLSRYLAVGPAGLLEMRVDGDRRTTCSTSCCCWASRCPSSASLALPWQARDRAAAAGRCSLGLHHVPRDEPPVPGRDDLGHVPPRGRPGPRPAAAQRPRRARRRVRPAGPAARLGQAGRVAGRRARGLRLAAVQRRRCCRRSAPAHAPTRAHVRGRSRRQMAAIGAPARRLGAGHPRLPDLARGDRSASAASRCPTSRRRTSWTSPPTRVRRPAADQSPSDDESAWPAILDRRRTRRRPASRRSPARSRTTPPTPPRSRTIRVFRIECQGVARAGAPGRRPGARRSPRARLHSARWMHRAASRRPRFDELHAEADGGARLCGQHPARHPRPLPLHLSRGPGALGRARATTSSRSSARTARSRPAEPSANGTSAHGAAEAGAADLRLRMLRATPSRARIDLGRHEAELSRLELGDPQPREHVAVPRARRHARS